MITKLAKQLSAGYYKDKPGKPPVPDIDLATTDKSFMELRAVEKQHGWDAFLWHGMYLEDLLNDDRVHKLEMAIINPATADSHSQWSYIGYNPTSQVFHITYHSTGGLKGAPDAARPDFKGSVKPPWYKFLIPGQQAKWNKISKHERNLHDELLDRWYAQLKFLSLVFKVSKNHKIIKPRLMVLDSQSYTKMRHTTVNIWES